MLLFAGSGLTTPKVEVVLLGYASAHPASGFDLADYGAIKERDMVRCLSWLVTSRVAGQELGVEWGPESNDFVGGEEQVRGWRRVKRLCHSVDGKILRSRFGGFASEEVLEGWQYMQDASKSKSWMVCEAR